MTTLDIVLIVANGFDFEASAYTSDPRPREIFESVYAQEEREFRRYARLVRVGTCTFSGQLKGDWTNARAELIDDLQQIEFAYALLRKKYGMSFRIGNIFSRLVGNYRRRQIIKVDVTEHVFVEST